MREDQYIVVAATYRAYCEWCREHHVATRNAIFAKDVQAIRGRQFTSDQVRFCWDAHKLPRLTMLDIMDCIKTITAVNEPIDAKAREAGIE